MPRRVQVAVVTEAVTGLGYHIGKELIRRVPSTVAYMTTSGHTGGMEAILGMELGGAARQRGKFITMDVTDQLSIIPHSDAIGKRYGGLDIIVNNAEIYEKFNLAEFKAQAKRIIATNYWGTRNVCSAFSLHEFKKDARIVNITSKLAQVKENITCVEDEIKRKTLDRFDAVRSTIELDGMVRKFQDDVISGRYKDEEWPECAYTVSKMAVNTLTRLLQQEFDQKKRPDVLVNAVCPTPEHPIIDPRASQEATQFIFYMATSLPNNGSIFPRGEVVWENMMLLTDRKKRKTA